MKVKATLEIEEFNEILDFEVVNLYLPEDVMRRILKAKGDNKLDRVALRFAFEERVF